MKPAPGRWALVGCWMAANIWLSHQSHLAGPSIPGADKAEHLVEYGIFAFLLARAWFPLLRHRSPGERMVLLVVACLLWGVGDEIHQSFVPGRSAEALDVLADTTGGLLVAMLMRSVKRG